MSRLIIHVGTHKTATTHIQDTFHKNRALLRRHGVVVPEIGTVRGQHALVTPWIPLPAMYSIDDPHQAWLDLVEEHCKGGETVFVSSEEFSRLRPARVDMAALKQLVSRFDQVRILCTLRNQASFLQSVYQQISDERQPAPWPDLLEHALRQRMIDGLAVDYNLLYDHLLTGFSPDQIRFVSFDAAVGGAGGIVDAYLRELGVALTEDQLEPFGTERSNVSPQPLATLIANEVSRPAVAKPRIVRLLGDCMADLLAQGTRSTIFSQAEMKQVQEAFAPRNRRLMDRIAPFQPDFELSETPRKAEQLLYREQLDETFWIGTLRRLAQ